MNSLKTPRLLSPRSFVRLLGAEYELMRNAGVLRTFYLASVLILLILLLTFISVFYAITLLFHAFAIELILAIFFSALFVCIYIFLLNTFTKEKRHQKKVLTASNIIRICFVAFIGFLMAQPLLIMLFSSSLSALADNYKESLLNVHIAKINQLVVDDVSLLSKRRERLLTQKSKSGTIFYDSEIDDINAAITRTENKAIQLTQKARIAISQNNFFIFRVQRLYRTHPFAVMLSLLIVLLFVLPGYLVFNISAENEYYQLKKQRDNKLILDAYADFINDYKVAFHTPIDIFCRFENPPFNSIRKQLPAPLANAEFLKKYLNNG